VQLEQACIWSRTITARGVLVDMGKYVQVIHGFGDKVKGKPRGLGELVLLLPKPTNRKQYMNHKSFISVEV